MSVLDRVRRRRRGGAGPGGGPATRPASVIEGKPGATSDRRSVAEGIAADDPPASPPACVCHHCGIRLTDHADGPRPGVCTERTARLLGEWPSDQLVVVADRGIRRTRGTVRPPLHLDGLAWLLVGAGVFALVAGWVGVGLAASGWTAETVARPAAAPVLRGLLVAADWSLVAAAVVLAGCVVLGVESVRAPGVRPRRWRSPVMAAHCPDCLRTHHPLVRWITRLPWLAAGLGAFVRIGRPEDVGTRGRGRRRGPGVTGARGGRRGD